MIELVHSFSCLEEQTIERVLEDSQVGINHMILPKGGRLPEHRANSNVYMIVARGAVSLQLEDQEPHIYPAGALLVIPFRTLMNVLQHGEETLELFVVKSPSPRNMK